MKAQTPKYFNSKLSLGILFLPLSLLYWGITKLKGKFARPYRSRARVVCVGNITLGGVGKTPLTIKIVEHLLSENVRVGILSRGYGGSLSSSVPVVVDTSIHTARDVGDEVFMMASKFKGVPVCICTNRANGAKILEKDVDVIVMDDGLQNYTLQKDISVVVFDGKDSIGNGFIFPAGPLRESLKSGMVKADAVVITRCKNPKLEEKVRTFGIPVFNAKTVAKKIDVKPASEVIAFAGIGKPQKFYDSLKNSGLRIIKSFNFPDHYQYSKRDIENILDLAGGLPVLTTMKDFVKIPQNLCQKIIPVDIDLTISGEKKFFEIIGK